MCCEVCPYYDECRDMETLNENCCPECPDYEECQANEKYDEEDTDFIADDEY
ncbi:MAG: hypothetical protein ABIK31_02435 [candidate division WOR-3 bacterium]